MFVAGVMATAAGCSSSAPDAVFAHTQWESARDARSILDTYKHVLVVCIYEDHWEDRGPGRLSLHHFKGTVVRSYTGNWNVAERIGIVHGVDAPALTVSNALAGYLMFVFTNEHTSMEIGLDTGEFGNYDSNIDRALESLYPRKLAIEPASARSANQSVEPTGGSRSAQTAFVSPWRLPPVAHALR